MRRLSLALGLLAACAATGASAETVNLTGTYRCIQMCRNGMLGAPTFVTQNGDAVNLTTETGESYRAWPDWSAPGPIPVEPNAGLSVPCASPLVTPRVPRPRRLVA